MATILEHFDVLINHGLKVIPLRQNSKIPMCLGWNRNWNRKIVRDQLRKNPNCNIGFLLGDIIDVEGDSPEANLIIERLVGDYPHPTYRSTRSVHHLFKTPDADLRIFKHNDVEFRGHGHQSVLPPSKHEEIIYKWLSVDFPIPEMPEELFAFYRSKKLKQKRKIKPGHIRVWCACCQKQFFIHKNRFTLELESFQLLGHKWNCQKCRLVDLRPVVRILRKEKNASCHILKWNDGDDSSCLEKHARMLVRQ